MSNGHSSADCAVVTAFNGILFLLTNPLGYINPFLNKNGTVAQRNGTILCQNGSSSWRQRLRFSHQRQLQRLLVEATMKAGATTVPVLLEWPLPLRYISGCGGSVGEALSCASMPALRISSMCIQI